MPTDETENWAIKRGKRGHNLELTVRLVLCEHKIVNDSGPAWNFWFHFIELGDISYNCVWWVGGKFSIERIHPEKRNFPCNVFYCKKKEFSLLERKKFTRSPLKAHICLMSIFPWNAVLFGALRFS